MKTELTKYFLYARKSEEDDERQIKTKSEDFILLLDLSYLDKSSIYKIKQEK